jgi:hypothetical protein
MVSNTVRHTRTAELAVRALANRLTSTVNAGMASAYLTATVHEETLKCTHQKKNE